MKLLTLNTHSLAETEYERKLEAFVAGILEEQPDIMALQEVNQSISGEEVPLEELLASGYVESVEMKDGSGDLLPSPAGQPASAEPPHPIPPVRRDNHGFRVASLLAKAGCPYRWAWVPAKLGYGKYDEGTALFSRRPIDRAFWQYLTDSRDYTNWKTRKALGITVQTEGSAAHFFSLHMGWWQDEEEPFTKQWERLSRTAETLKDTGAVWLMGDFNSQAGVRGEGYDLIRGAGWEDVYEAAARKGGEMTVPGEIDGWRTGEAASGMRIDYIWHGGAENVDISWAGTVFDGKNRQAVSDHFGLMAEYARN